MRKIQRIRGLATTPKTVAEYAEYTGHRGELVSVFDENGNVAEPFLVVHDGVTKGGWKYDNLQVPGGEQEGTEDTGSLPTQPPSAQGISSGWLKDSALIDYSAYFDGSSRLSRTPNAGNRKTWTWSGWVKFNSLGSEDDLFGVRIDGDNQFRFYKTSGDKLDFYNQVSGSVNTRLITTQLFRDTSTWYHFVLQLDTTNSNMNLYVNGSKVIVLDTNMPPSNNDTQINTTNLCEIGGFSGPSFNGRMANIHFIDGAALDESYFGETVEGNWIHRLYDGTSTVEGATTVSGLGGTNDKYGINGFHLNFADESNLGKDVSGNGNDWA